MREYLSALAPLIRDGAVQYTGETLAANLSVDIAGSSPCPILLAALGTQMLELAGQVADGTCTWMTGPATLAEHTTPTITKAAAEAGRPAPRISASLPVRVTTDVDAAREQAARVFQIYGMLPSYRAMLDREGAEGPADVAIIGDEATVRAAIQRVAESGATDFVAVEFGGSPVERAETRELLRSLI
jgi:F420-dependent oxidoreductase-like protein